MMRSLLLLCLLALAPFSQADETVARAVKQAVFDNLRYIENEDVSGAMSTLHRDSLNYQPTLQALQQFIGVYKLSYEITEFRFIGVDGELALARVKQRTRKLSGPAFQDNELDMVQIFKQEEGVWKLWSQANMEIDYL